MITTFWCSVLSSHKCFITRINLLCSVFLWKEDIESHNSTRVSWEKVILTNYQGGLALKIYIPGTKLAVSS